MTIRDLIFVVFGVAAAFVVLRIMKRQAEKRKERDLDMIRMGRLVAHRDAAEERHKEALKDLGGSLADMLTQDPEIRKKMQEKKSI